MLAESAQEFVLSIGRFLRILPPNMTMPEVTTPIALPSLTPREVEVLALLVAGQSNREIAEALVLSERTVARHIANVYQKTAVHGRAQITAYALRHNLV